MAGKELKGREKVVSKMTRDGLTEENLADGSVKDISHKSRGRPPEMKQDFVFDREKKKDKLSDGQSEERNLQKKQIRNSSLRKEAISEEPILEESVLDGEGAGEKNVSEKSPQYKKKFREHAQIPEDDSLTGQKKKIRKKQIQKQMRKEQAKSGRLSFDDEENQMVKGPGIKPGRTIGRYAVRDAISKGVSDPEEEEQDVATETVQFAERGTETAIRGLRYAQLRSQRADVKANRRGYHLDETGEKLKFGMSDSMGKAGAEEMAKKSEQKKRVLNRFFQRKRYKDAYRAARTGKTAGSAGGAATVAGVENITVKAKIALKEIVKRNRAVFFGAGIFVLLFLIVAVSLGSCSASIQGGGSVIEITTYPGTDEDIYAAENYYVSLETALNQQINEMEATHPDYDEYQYNVGEIAHNPYHLISYLTAKYGDWKFEDIKDELQALFEAQYSLDTESKTETVTETKTVRVGESLGNVVTSGYCNCSICCGQWSGGPTASGVYPTANHTIAVDASDPFVPMGTKIVMNGVEYTVEDTGAFARYGVQFDVYYDNHSAASAHGHKTWECYLADDNGSQEVEVTRTRDVDVLNVTLNSGNLMSICQDRLGFFQKELFSAYNDTKGNLQMFATPVDFNWYSSVTSYYGYRIHPISGANQLHNGMDIGAPEGTKVMAGLTGTVTTSAYNDSYGNYVVIKDSKGYELRYAHLSSRSVSAGASVTKGDEIGLVGNTGNSTGSHLHIELLKNGERLNPIFYLETGEGAGFGGNEYTSEAAQRLLNEAARYLGTPYVWGGYSPSGFDCSGFVSYCLTNSGVRNTGRLTAQGLYNICTPVSQSEAQPGDLIFFTGTYDAGEPVTHIGIYVGNGQMIHCGHPVQYTSINSPYWQSHFYGFGRW